MTRPTATTLILGAGPAGLVAALAAARCGPVELITQRLPRPDDPSRIDAVPASFLALLLELGIHPASLGVGVLHDQRLVAWESGAPRAARGHAMAHLERPRLELALLSAVGRAPMIHIDEAAAGAASTASASIAAKAELCIDATGRRAVTAEALEQPPAPFHARVLVFDGTPSPATQAFRMAPLPDGYAYRLGSATSLVLGLVGGAAAQPVDTTVEHLRAAGAGWLLAGLPPLARARRGRGGPASVQWRRAAVTSAAEAALFVPVGDADLARDALSSQGLATGAAEAFQIASREERTNAAWTLRRDEQRRRHLASLEELLGRCRFRDRPFWADYAGFIAAHRRASDRIAAPVAAASLGVGLALR